MQLVDGPQNSATQTFEAHRGRLLGLAYRMLGSRADAEDLVQETWLRWAAAAPGELEAPWAWLARVASRLCLDQLKSARSRREFYPGPWLPEPLACPEPAAAGDQEARVELPYALMVVLDQLNPLERAVYILREAFDFGYGDIASWLELGEAHARQLGHRARSRIERRPCAQPAAPARHDELLRRFMAAARAGEFEQLLQLFQRDALLVADGGGKATSALRPLQGADRIARFLCGLARKFPGALDAEQVWANGAPALVVRQGQRVVTAIFLEVGEQAIAALYLVRNPDKLTTFGAAQGDVPPPAAQRTGIVEA